MDWKFIVRHAGSIMFVFVALGGWSGYNLKSTSEIFEKRSELAEKRSEFEKYKTEETQRMAEKELGLNKEKLRLEAFEKQLEEKRAQLAGEAAQAEGKLRTAAEKEQRVLQAANSLSAANRRAQEETEIQNLMREFSDLGVDLHAPAPCKNREDLAKYNRGKALISQISARAEAAGVYEKYRGYILNNQGNSIILRGFDCQ